MKFPSLHQFPVDESRGSFEHAALAGDAAHQMPPFAGQGMCAGVRDAANLAWKLDLVLRGLAADAVLDSYASERIPRVRQVIDFSIELGKVICVPDPALAAARDAAMIAAVKDRGPTPPLPTPAIGPGVLVDGDPLAGHLFLQGEVRRGNVTGRFDDVVGRGFTLASPVADPATRLTPELATFFASLDGISAHVAPKGPSTTCTAPMRGGSRRTASASCSSVPTSTSSGALLTSTARLHWSPGCEARSRVRLRMPW